jgi:hypothetical protein
MPQFFQRCRKMLDLGVLGEVQAEIAFVVYEEEDLCEIKCISLPCPDPNWITDERGSASIGPPAQINIADAFRALGALTYLEHEILVWSLSAATEQSGDIMPVARIEHARSEN